MAGAARGSSRPSARSKPRAAPDGSGPRRPLPPRPRPPRRRPPRSPGSRSPGSRSRPLVAGPLPPPLRPRSGRSPRSLAPPSARPALRPLSTSRAGADVDVTGGGCFAGTSSMRGLKLGSISTTPILGMSGGATRGPREPRRKRPLRAGTPPTGAAAGATSVGASPTGVDSSGSSAATSSGAAVAAPSSAPSCSLERSITSASPPPRRPRPSPRRPPRAPVARSSCGSRARIASDQYFNAMIGTGPQMSLGESRRRRRRDVATRATGTAAITTGSSGIATMQLRCTNG